MDKNENKKLFLLDESVTYLNCANMSPVLKSVNEAGMQALKTRATPWKIKSEDWFTNAEELRGLAAKIFQTSDNNIALIPSVSYGLAVAAKNLRPKKGKEIIVLENQFPSNYYVWENLAHQLDLRIVFVKRERDKTLTKSILERISDNTGIVAIPNCHWIDGAYIDLQQISDAIKMVDCYFVLDASQSLGALPINIDSIQPDFAVSVGYKWMLGPYGLGYMYVSKKWQDTGEPLEYSWLTKKGSEDFAKLTNYVNGYRDGARKFDMGEFPQFNLLPMAIAALTQILNWEVNNIQVVLSTLTKQISLQAKESDLTVSDNNHAGHLIGLLFEESTIADINKHLATKNIKVSFRGSTMRIAPHLHNDVSDIEKLFEVVRSSKT